VLTVQFTLSKNNNYQKNTLPDTKDNTEQKLLNHNDIVCCFALWGNGVFFKNKAIKLV